MLRGAERRQGTAEVKTVCRVKLLTKREAAERCRVSVAAFDAHVRPALTPKRIGRRVLFLESELEAWAETAKVGHSAAKSRAASGTSVSPLLAELLSDPQVQATAQRLRQRQRASTPTLSLAPPSHDARSAVVVPLRPSRSS